MKLVFRLDIRPGEYEHFISFGQAIKFLKKHKKRILLCSYTYTEQREVTEYPENWIDVFNTHQ